METIILNDNMKAGQARLLHLQSLQTYCMEARQGKVVSALFLDTEGAFPNAVTNCLLHNMKKQKLLLAIISFVERMIRD